LGCVWSGWQDSGLSAFAAQGAAVTVSSRTERHPLPSITVRVSAAEKACFAMLARARGMSESALALEAIRSITAPVAVDMNVESRTTPASDRITIRLRPGDGHAIARRARERGMKSSAYLAGLVRAHVATNPPLATQELATLKYSLHILVKLGIALLSAGRDPALSGPALEDLRRDISRTRAAVATVEGHVHDAVKKALAAWESRSA